MKKATFSRSLISALVVLVLAGFAAWLIRLEGERTRRLLRDNHEHARPGRQGDSPAGADAHPATVTQQPSEKQRTAAKTADTKRPGVAPPAEAKEDFNLNDFDVFPGLDRPAPKTQPK